MCISAYYAHQNAEELKKNRIFKKAKEKFQIAFELYNESRMHAHAIDCLIQKTVCIIEAYLQDSMFSQESEANNILQRYLNEMEEEITKVSKKLNEKTRYNSLRRAYLQIEELYKEYGFFAEASRCLSRSVHYRLKLASSKEKLSSWIFEPFTRYDKKKWVLLIGSFFAVISVILLIFGAVYCRFELIKFSEENNSPLGFLDSFYFSVVTFATLGYGDIKPACTQGRMVAISEVILGYVILGLFISILAWKITQR